MEGNLVNDSIKAFEERFMMKFKLSNKLCQKLGIQRKRILNIIDNQLEPTVYECMVFERFLEFSPVNRRKKIFVKTKDSLAESLSTTPSIGGAMQASTPKQ